jgi:hypothetical protein
MTDLPFSPAADRNKHALLQAMQQALPSTGRLLEVASGTGQHAAWLGSHMPNWEWQPTECNDAALPVIAARSRQVMAPNIKPPCLLDAAQTPWSAGDETQTSVFEQPFDAIFSANLLHISPWSVALGLFSGAAQNLRTGGLLLIYGPFFEDDTPPAPSNIAFDASLRAQDPQWGVRSLNLVNEAARAAGLEPAQRIEMPANNLLLVMRQTRSPAAQSRPPV